MSNVIKFDNFLDKSLYLKMRSYSHDMYHSGEHVLKTHKCWNNTVVLDSFPVLIYRIPDEEKVMKDLTTTINQKTGMNYSVCAGFYYWTRFSYIPWHEDSHLDAAMTIYLNDKWTENNGGYLMYEDGDEIKAILPQKNRAIWQRNGVRHSTSAVNYDGDIRYTIQCWLTEIKDGA